MYVCPSESDVVRFTELKQNGIFDPSVSDEYVIGMLQEGIHSTNAEVVKLAIQALGRYTDSVLLRVDGSFGQVPRRSFEDASTLKRSLIRHWEIGHAGSGFNTTRQMEIDLQEGVNYRQSVIDGNGDEEGSEEPDLRAFWDAVRDKVSLGFRFLVCCVCFGQETKTYTTLFGNIMRTTVMLLQLGCLHS